MRFKSILSVCCYNNSNFFKGESSIQMQQGSRHLCITCDRRISLVCFHKNGQLLTNVELEVEWRLLRTMFRTVGTRRAARILGSRRAPLSPT